MEKRGFIRCLRSLIGTNILVYAMDKADPVKQDKCRNLLRLKQINIRRI